MSEENQAIVQATEAETVPVQDQDATAAPDTVDQQPEEATEPAPKVFTQEELDEILEKRLARERKRMQRELEHRPVEPSYELQTEDDQQLTPAQIIAQYEAQKRQAAAREAYFEREAEALEKYADFEQVAYNPTLKITDDMAEIIQESPIGTDVLYWLGSNPNEAARIAALPQALRGREVGKIEARLEANPPAKKTTSAPAPISPVTRPNGGARAIDTTDPRSIKEMDTSAWIEADRQRMIRKLEAQRR